MVGSMIHHQNDQFFQYLLHQQFFQEANEGEVFLRPSSCPGDGVFQPVITAKDRSLLLCTRASGRNTPLLSTLHTARPQRRIQGYGRFVHKDECEIVSEDLFFNSSNTSDAFSLASLSCKWLKAYYGQQYQYPLRFNKALKRLSLRPIPVFFSRWARKRSMVQIAKSYPNSDGSFSITSSRAAVYSSSAFGGRPLFGLLASPSNSATAPTIIPTVYRGFADCLHFCNLSWLMPQVKQANDDTSFS